MLRIPVVSTNVASVGYEDQVLEVQFLNGSVYQYYNVPESIYQHLISYPHPGTFLAHAVKGRYRYQRVR
nr:MAG TPA: KTSC domain [Caudoviricetes sp.]